MFGWNSFWGLMSKYTGNKEGYKGIWFSNYTKPSRCTANLSETGFLSETGVLDWRVRKKCLLPYILNLYNDLRTGIHQSLMAGRTNRFMNTTWATWVCPSTCNKQEHHDFRESPLLALIIHCYVVGYTQNTTIHRQFVRITRIMA